MNTWCNTEKPPLNQPIFITDGETVYFGHYEISPISKSTFFMGADIENGDIFTIAPDGLKSITGWQPAPDTWKPEKTADELFRELGYTWEGTPNGNGREYEGEIGDTVTVTRFGATFKDPGMEKGVRIGRDYILACAQLIREMEANNG